jgi:DNA-binding PadR family transcriptional regulator
MATLRDAERNVLYAIQHRREDAYGVTIRQEIKARTQRDLSFGALYPILDRLEERGFIKSHNGGSSPERGGRPKKLYSVTGEGMRALKAAEREYERMRAPTPTPLPA